jgi:hypothetical protein
LKRDEALALLKDLMYVCDSMRFAPIVSLTPSSTLGSWKLTVKWVNDNDRSCFDKIIRERGLEVEQTEDGYTTFLKPIETKE